MPALFVAAGIDSSDAHHAVLLSMLRLADPMPLAHVLDQLRLDNRVKSGPRRLREAAGDQEARGCDS